MMLDKEMLDKKTLRKSYENNGLQRAELDSNPILQFEHWFKDTQQANIYEPSAMSLTTATKDGQPRIRTVLLKFFDENGFVFFTNYGSRKASDIENNPKVALLFPWVELSRQVIIEGSVSKVSTTESLKYFASRPRDSQIGAWVSQQSHVLKSRGVLEQKLAEMKAKFGEGQIPLPSFWGGFRVAPSRIEFWQGRPHRLHDRFEYIRQDSGWHIQRLQP